MKKIITLFIAVLYLAVSSGLAVEIHRCMGEINDFSFTTATSNTCGKCGMPKGSKNCCKDELKFIKLQDSYKLSNVNYQLAIPEANINNNQYLVNNSFVHPALITTEKNQSPPGSLSSPLFILNCVFRI